MKINRDKLILTSEANFRIRWHFTSNTTTSDFSLSWLMLQKDFLIAGRCQRSIADWNDRWKHEQMEYIIQIKHLVTFALALDVGN